MVKRLHDSHLSKKFLLLVLIQRSFFYFFGCSENSIILGSNLINSSEASSSDLFQNDVVIKVVSFFHFDKIIPFNSDLLSVFFNLLGGFLHDLHLSVLVSIYL